MQVDFYLNNSEDNQIGKNITLLYSADCLLKNDTDEIRPTIIMSNKIEVMQANYIYIPSFGRYYFISSTTVMTGNRYEITCSVDVLESYRQEILNLRVIVDKQEDIMSSNLYINDGSFVEENRTFNTIINFERGFNNEGEFILITAGG